MKILLDENMPESVRRELLRRGHAADSIASLRLKGLDNGRLYREIAVQYEIFLSKDREFVKSAPGGGRVTMVHVVLPQCPALEFTRRFVDAFEATIWSDVVSGESWPAAPGSG